MRVSIPVQVNSSAVIGKLGFTLHFNPSDLYYLSDQQDVVFNPSLNTTKAYVAFDGAGYISPYIEGVALQPGTFNLCNVNLNVIDNRSGISPLQITGQIQPFIAWGPNYEPLTIAASGGTVDLTTGAVTPVVLTVAPGAAQVAVNTNYLNNISNPETNSGAASNTSNPVADIIDHVTSAISTITGQVSNTVNGVTKQLPPLSGGNASAVDSLSNATASVKPYLPLIGLGVIAYLIFKK